ncbi:MAG: hypothetical protein WD208_05025 [Dehalococcoidia bacterium]
MRFTYSRRINTRILALSGLVILIAGVMAAMAFSPGGALGVEPLPTPAPTEGVIEPGSNHDGLGYTREEADQILQEAREQGHVVRTSGPETAGSTIEVTGVPIQLPEDAYVAHRIAGGTCIDPDYCPKAPFYVIARGSSSIVADLDGELMFEELAEGEEDAFDFLREALQ